MLTPNQVAKMLNVAPVTVRSWASRGLLESTHTAGGHRRFSYEEVVRFARDRGIRLASGNSLGQMLKVLVIDDDIFFGKMMTSYISVKYPNSDVRFLDAPDEVQGVLFDFSPQIVFIDIRMPKRNGFELFKILKNEAHSNHVKVIGMTGSFSNEVVRRAFEFGADACLGKPIDEGELDIIVREVL